MGSGHYFRLERSHIRVQGRDTDMANTGQRHTFFAFSNLFIQEHFHDEGKIKKVQEFKKIFYIKSLNILEKVFKCKS